MKSHYLKIVNDILDSTLSSVDPEKSIERVIEVKDQRYLKIGGKSFDLKSIDNIYVIGAGKGAASMVSGLRNHLGQRIRDGVVIVKHLEKSISHYKNIRYFQGNHPVPGPDSLESTKELVKITSKFTEKDLVLCVITGGGSALMTLPRENIELDDLREITELLLRCGATIQEINTIRKHLDQVKGGGIAQLVSPAQLVTLILSDVIGNPIDIIASGPTVPDPSTFQDALSILERYKIVKKCPTSILSLLRKGARGEVLETGKEDDKYFQEVHNVIIGDNLHACQAAKEKCIQLGLNSIILTTSLRGEAREVGVFLSAVLREMALTSNPIPRPACIIAGGETTVTLQGQGRGGRNQELALSAVKELAGLNNIALVTLATDGEDGPTDSAGAIVWGDSLERGNVLGLDPQEHLSNNDSYNYFQRLNDSIKIGPTGTNVNDITFLFAF